MNNGDGHKFSQSVKLNEFEKVFDIEAVKKELKNLLLDTLAY